MNRGGLACVLAAFAAASCGGGGSSPTNPGSTTGGSTATVVTITIVGVNGKLSFSPNPAEVQPGQMVVFRNNDVVSHRVTLDDMSIDSGDIPPGTTSRQLPLGAVNKSYHCSVHPSMVGSFNSAQTPDPPPCTGYCG
jgi:plastocyanin